MLIDNLFCDRKFLTPRLVTRKALNMDLVVRRQSEQLNRRHFSESLDDDDDDNNGKPNNKKFREIYDYRRWEWGNLRVSI